MLPVLHSQYHACWCTGGFRSQCISRHGIDPQSRNIPSPVSDELIKIQQFASEKRTGNSICKMATIFSLLGCVTENINNLVVSTESAEGLTQACRVILKLDKMAAILADDNFKCIFLNENVSILIKISLNFVPKGSINNIPALVEIMAWCQRGNKPLPEPMMTQLIEAYMRH